MGFQRLAPPARHMGGGFGTGVKCSVRVSKLGDPNVTLSIQKRIWEQLGGTGDKWAILEGDGENAGYLRVGRQEDGDFEPKHTVKGDALVFRLGELKCAPLKAQKARWCSFTVQGGALVIKLPSWAFPGQTPQLPKVRVDGHADQQRTVNLGEPTADFHKRRQEAETRQGPAVSPLKRPPGRPPGSKNKQSFGY